MCHLNLKTELKNIQYIKKCVGFWCRSVSPSSKLFVAPIRPVKSPVMTRKQVRTSGLRPGHSISMYLCPNF